MGIDRPNGDQDLGDIEAIEVTEVDAEEGVSKWGVVEGVTGWEHDPGRGYCRYDKHGRVVCMVRYENGAWAFYTRIAGSMDNELFNYGAKYKEEGETNRDVLLRAMRRCDLAVIMMNVKAATDEYERKTSE